MRWLLRSHPSMLRAYIQLLTLTQQQGLFIVTPSLFIVTPSRARGLLPAAGRKVLAFLGVLLTKHFRFLAPLEMTDMGRKKQIWAVRK